MSEANEHVTDRDTRRGTSPGVPMNERSERSDVAQRGAGLPEANRPAGYSGAAGHAAALIAMDTSNPGGPGTRGERAAARYIADQLAAAGATPELIEAEPGRTNVVLRIPGRRVGPGTVLHGHLDVVPADPREWSVDPFGGLIRDGFVWGRGAVDMKGADGMLLALAQRWLGTGVAPEHDVVLAWVADEETGGDLGAGHLTRTRPDLFEGCATAVGEVGGFSLPMGRGSTVYPVMTGERGQARVRLTARGRSGHSSVPAAGNPIATLSRAVVALAEHPFPYRHTDALDGFLAGLAELWRVDLGGPDVRRSLEKVGPLAALVEPAARCSATPTLLQAGTAVNVAPNLATATFDCRVLPAEWDAFTAALPGLVGDAVEIEVEHRSPGFETSFETDVVAAMGAALRVHDPGAITVPYMVSASTDAPHFARLGMQTLGFLPVQLPLGFQFGRMFHGVDERVPVAGLDFGVEVLDTWLSGC